MHPKHCQTKPEHKKKDDCKNKTTKNSRHLRYISVVIVEMARNYNVQLWSWYPALGPDMPHAFRLVCRGAPYP